MQNNKKEMLTKIKKGLCILVAATCIGTFSACGAEEVADEIESTQITQENKENEEKILFEREDGAVLQFLVVDYWNTNVRTLNVGYITYDENGTYFENVVTNVKIKISNESIFPGKYTKFYSLPFSSICNEADLINGCINLGKCEEILEGYKSYCDVYNRVSYTFVRPKDTDKSSISVYAFDPSSLEEWEKEDFVVMNKIVSNEQETTTYVDEELETKKVK